MGFSCRGNCKQNVICLMIIIVIFMFLFRLNSLLISKVRFKTYIDKPYIVDGKFNVKLKKEHYKNKDSAVTPRNRSESIVKNTHIIAKTNGRKEISKYILAMIKAIQQSDKTAEKKVNVLEHIGCPPVPRKVNGVEDLLCMPPPVFLPEFKNPCWYSNERRLQCLPYFQIIGMDKSGSTDLFDKIAKHPDVLKNDGILQKETMWWSWLRYGHWLKTRREVQPFQRYLQYFASAAYTIQSHPESRLITADGTPMDFWDMSGWVDIPQNNGLAEPAVITAHLIKHMNPRVKLIIILRDPVERLFSDYFFLKQGVMTLEGFHSEVVKSIEKLHSCTKGSSSLRGCLYNRNLHLGLNARIHLGFYSVFMKDWLKVFPREQFYITTTEMYSQSPSQILQEAFDFLDLRKLTRKEVDQFSRAERQHVTKNKDNLGQMLQQTRDILERLYGTFTKELASILEDDKYLWKKTVQT
ncbi:carbohydrate sulfotransferase 15-like [Mercenaria mercenaria]|uniref:carbohydrate sulfotransferase 15-like n=1 Tax=Mercenaria mercenaria TaxID=6596 RepID=UPI001E1DDA4C|nr:carbohydrate sulfotransferase 15-like [Mercenaria mercenaria]XP_045205509.1 carbohydrate sulfotransferase 15-like [Mercenaria mercenaria]